MKTSANLNLHYDHIVDAAHINCVIRHLRMNRSTDEKDKMIDELLIRKCERMRDELIEYGLQGIKRLEEVEKK